MQQGYLFWAVNGIGLAMVIPNGQSIIADSYPEASRGKAFGALYLTGAFGAMAGTLYATNMGAPAHGHLRAGPEDHWSLGAYFSVQSRPKHVYGKMWALCYSLL